MRGVRQGKCLPNLRVETNREDTVLEKSNRKRQPRKRRNPLSIPLRRMAPALLVLLALLTDTTILPLFYRGIYAPNVTLALILAYAIQRGSAMGFAYGTVAGLLLDISTSYPVGLYTGTILVAVAAASLCAFFQRNLGRTIVLAVIYLLYEAAFLIIAYAATVRMEPGYLLPALIRAASGVLLCSLLQLFVARYMKPKGVQVVRSRRNQEVKPN